MLTIRKTYSARRFGAAARIITVASAFAMLTGCMLFAQPPEMLDLSRTRASEGGLYRGTIRPENDSIPKGKLHSWTLHLETAEGAPVDGVTIAVDGGMPQHGHGLPTKPQVTRQADNGDHLVEGMKFNMGGWWVVKFRVSSTAGSDSLLFNLKL